MTSIETSVVASDEAAPAQNGVHVLGTTAESAVHQEMVDTSTQPQDGNGHSAFVTGSEDATNGDPNSYVSLLEKRIQALEAEMRKIRPPHSG